MGRSMAIAATTKNSAEAPASRTKSIWHHCTPDARLRRGDWGGRSTDERQARAPYVLRARVALLDRRSRLVKSPLSKSPLSKSPLSKIPLTAFPPWVYNPCKRLHWGDRWGAYVANCTTWCCSVASLRCLRVRTARPRNHNRHHHCSSGRG